MPSELTPSVRTSLSKVTWMRMAFGIAVVLLNGWLGLLFLFAPAFTQPIATDAMTAETGHNFIATFASRAAFPFDFTWDSSSSPQAAHAVVLEAGKPLGPAHVPHAEIREFGAGRFSFWSGNLYFSTSDNSDPRTNGRPYGVHYEAQPQARLVAAVLVADLLALFAFGATVAAFVAANAERIAALLALVFTGRIVAAAAHLAPPLFAGDASALDGPLVSAVVLHLLLGVALTVVVYATGSGLVLWTARNEQPLADLLLRAFLPGTILVAAAALLAISVPHGTILSLLVCLGAILPFRQYRVDRSSLAQAAAAPLLCLPFALLFAATLAFRFHGPSVTLPGAPLGDTTIYVGMANTLAQHVAPLYNYAAEGFRVSYGNVLPSLLATPLLARAWFDPYLFFSASLPIVAVLSMAMLIPLLGGIARAADGARLKAADLVILGSLVLGAFRYPGAMVESPSFVFLVPIVFSAVYLSLIPRPGSSRPWQALITAGVGSAISKVVSFAVLVPLALPELVREVLRRASRRQLLGAIVAGILILIYVLLAFRAYLPGFIKLGRFGPSSWDTIVRYQTTAIVPAACVLARDIGALVLAVAMTRSSLPGLALGVWTGILSFLIMPFLFHTNLTAVMLVSGLAYLVRPGDFATMRGPLLIAAALLLPQTVISEPGGSAVTMAWTFVVGFIAWTQGRGIGANRDTMASSAWGRRKVVFSTLATGLLVVVLWGVAAGALDAGSEAAVFTPDMRDIWLAVRDRTPKGSLIFTDQTGATESRTGGWNDFALAAQRQFFVVSWELTPLRYDVDLRRQWLDRNAAVLAGAEDPRDLKLSRPYDGFYAVIAAEHAPPAAATLVYVNPSYALYRLQAGT